jgi:hypothetical protein
VTARPGFALAVSLLLVVVLAALGAAMLALAAREAEIAAAMARRSDARATAESAVRWRLATWSTRVHNALGVGELATSSTPAALVAAHTDPGASVTVTRLATRLFLIEGTGRSGQGRIASIARAAVLVRTFDVEAMARAFRAAVAAGDSVLLHGGEISGLDWCGEESVPAILAPYWTSGSDAGLEGDPPALTRAPPDVPLPDPFVDPLAAAVATVMIPGGSVAPRPWIGPDGCADDPHNWGALSPTSACYERLPLIRAMGELEVVGGEGRGLLVADADLHLQGVHFHGLIVVHGRLTIADGSMVRGAVRARTAEVHGGAVTYDACALRDALSAGGLDGAFRPGDRWWIPVF